MDATPSGIEQSYSTRYAANRARDRLDDPQAFDILKREDGRHVLVSKAPPPRKRAEKKADPKPRVLGARAKIEADAQAGKIPAPPDFSADTHTRFRPKLAELVALVKAKDVKGLKAYPINPISTSPKAMNRYRNLAVVALEAQARA
jgi:hypothetical protein